MTEEKEEGSDIKQTDSYNARFEKIAGEIRFVVSVTKGSREFKVVRPASEIKKLRASLKQQAKIGLRKGYI